MVTVTSRMVFSCLLAAVMASEWGALAADDLQSQNQIRKGIVKDQQGQPVAGAQVWAIAAPQLPGRDVIERATTDAGGQFKVIVADPLGDRPAAYQPYLGILARHENHGIGALAFFREGGVPERPLEIVLPAAARAAVQVLDPDGKPLADASVKAASIHAETIYVNLSEGQARQNAKQFAMEPRKTPWGFVAARFPVPLPTEVAQELLAQTDAQGRATLAVSHADLYSVSVEAPGYGEQHFSRTTLFAKDEQPLETIKLQPVVELTGQLIGDGNQVAGKEFHLQSYGTIPAGSKNYGSVQTTVTTDGEGRFQALVLEGQVMAYFQWDAKSSLRPTPPEQFVTKRGGKNHMEIPLVPAVKIFGFIHDAETGKGVAGMRVFVWNWMGSEPLTTDESGRYETAGAPGPARVVPVFTDVWFPADKSLQITQENVSAPEHQLKPVRVQRAATLVGTVVDHAGEPIADASVAASWFGYSRVLSRADLNSELVKTDAEGKFTVRGIDPTSECRVTAEKGNAFTAAAQIIKGETEPLTLEVSEKHGWKLAGRIVDASGKPVAGARLELWRRPWAPQYHEIVPELVDLEDWKTDEQGRFAAPAMRPDGHYRVALVDPRYEPSQTAWIDASGGKSTQVPDLLARKLGEHLGVVKDGSGKPVSGAMVVFQGGGKRIEAKTDDEGKFKLSPAPDGPGMLFVSKQGCRFHGRRLQTFGQPVAIKLANVGEPYGEKLVAKPAAVSLEKRRELALKLADELIKQIGLDLSGEQRYQILLEVAKVDPQAALERVEKKRFLVGMMNDGVRFQAARTLMAESPEEAIELVEGITSFQHMQVMTYADVAASLPPDQRDRKLELLAEALVKAQGIKEAGFRLISIAKVAEGLLDMSEKERGASLLKDHADSAKKLNKAGYDAFLRGMYAEELAQVDLESALAMDNEINDYSEKVRHLGNIAHELAAIRPAEAERILRMIPPPPEGSNILQAVDPAVVRACYRMAKVDLARAKELAAKCLDPFYKAHAHGAIAVAISKDDAKQAADLMRKAFDSLDDAALSDKALPVSGGNAGNVGGWLVWQAQQIDPELGAEMLWRLLAVLPEEPSSDPQKTWRDTEGLGAAAMFLSLIDESLARDLLSRLKPTLTAAHGRSYLPAWGLIDPENAKEKAKAAGDEASLAGRKRQLIGAIGASGEQRLKIIHYHAGLWRIDVEDIDP